MTYIFIITLIQTFFSLTLLVIYFRYKKIFRNKKTQTPSLKDNDNKINLSNYYGVNHRKTFRVSLDAEECLVEFVDFEDSRLNKLKNKQFIGHLENISLGGLKLTCNYDLPIEKRIITRITFSLNGHDFSCQTQILRKEVHSQKNTFSYGAQFIDLPHNKQTELMNVLNQILIKYRRKKIS